MSQTHEESITCPNCGQAVSFTAYDTLNRAFDPEAADKLMNGNFFEVSCPHCGTVSNPLYPMLYHDPENITLIWYSYDREFLTNSAALLDELREQVPAVAELAAGYRLRIVDDPLVLSEKALIFKHELDDRLIEIYKLRVEESTTGNSSRTRPRCWTSCGNRCPPWRSLPRGIGSASWTIRWF